MDNSQNPAIVGIWRDFTTGGKLPLGVSVTPASVLALTYAIPEQLLSIRSPWGIIIVAIAGIWLTWCTKYIRKILGNCALWIHLQQHQQPHGSASHAPASEVTPLLSQVPETSVAKDAQILARMFKEKSGVRDLFVDSLTSNKLANGDKLRLLVFTVCVALCVLGIMVGGYSLASISLDGPAKLASAKCGLWLFESEKRSGEATRARMLDLAKEERAAQFAEDCYGQSGPIGPNCKIFYQPTLPSLDASYTNNCPFQNDICLWNSTVTFGTPVIDAKDLGINSPSTPKFRRSTSCTPLSMEYPYIQNKTENGTTTFTYHYGTRHGEGAPLNYTYKTVGDPWDRNAPVYDVFAYSSNADDSDAPLWIPHPHLTPPKYSTVTIFFVSSLRILYETYSTDPIFPADKKWPIPGDPHRPWFRNSDPRARPLACVNTIEACAQDGVTCWNINEPSSNVSFPDNTPEFVLLYASLYKTDIYYSLAKRQGRALLAQKKVSQYFSAPLGVNPWVAEVENLVKIALARTTINAWSVASGEDSIHAGREGFIEVTKGYGNLCGRYKYNPQGYHSVRFVPLMLIVACLPLIWFLSLDWKVSNRCNSTLHSALQKFRVHRARSRQDGDVAATLSSTGDTFSQPTTVPSHEEATIQQPAIASDAEPSTINAPQLAIEIPPLEESPAQPLTTPPEAGNSPNFAVQHHSSAQQTSTTYTTHRTTTTEDSAERSDEELIKWEPLVWHMLIVFLVWKPFVWLVIGLSYPFRLLCEDRTTEDRHS
jgi:hypothetical protein